MSSLMSLSTKLPATPPVDNEGTTTPPDHPSIWILPDLIPQWVGAVSARICTSNSLKSQESVCSNRLCMCTVTMAFTGQPINLHNMAGISSMDNLYLAGKTPLLVGDMLVNFGDILPEIIKSSACWGMERNFHLTWLSSDRLYMPLCIELELKSSEGVGREG